jgi:DNA repair protein Rad10
MQVNPKQKGNPVLQYITNVWWDYVEGLSGGGGGGPDFVVGSGAAALYLSLKYHLLHPDYIHKRTRGLSRDRYKLRVLLVLVSGARRKGAGRGEGGKRTSCPQPLRLPRLSLVCPPADRRRGLRQAPWGAQQARAPLRVHDDVRAPTYIRAPSSICVCAAWTCALDRSPSPVASPRPRPPARPPPPLPTRSCAFSVPEAARYLETYKAYENKGASAIQERVESTFLPRAQEALTTVRR